MIYKCQRKPIPRETDRYHQHHIEAPDEATARVMMYNRSFSHDWLDHDKTLVWSDEDWTAL
jgi:hypothetical protein